MKLRTIARTDVGRTRDHNEDSFGIGDGAAVELLGSLLVVCDGMGGHAAGEVASALAVETIEQRFYQDQNGDRTVALDQAFQVANDRVFTQGRGTMGTTGVAAVLHHDALVVANVGDSRAYLLRKDTIRQLTRDHSFVSDQLAAGLITAEQARVSIHRNIITRALGHQQHVTVDTFRWPLQVGDMVLLCSDGLHGLVDDDELLELAHEVPFEQLPDALIALANDRGGSDNITAALALVEALDWESAPVDLPEDERPTDKLPPPSSAITQPITERLPVEQTPASLPDLEPNRIPEPPAQRRLSLLGGLLAAVLLVVLAGAILGVFNPLLGIDPLPTRTPAATVVTTPAATAAATSVATPAATGVATPAATGVATPGTRATALPTANAGSTAQP